MAMISDAEVPVFFSNCSGLADERTLFCDLMVDAASIDLMTQMNTGERAIEGDALI